MSKSPPSLPSEIAGWIYRQSLRLYPGQFRDRYRHEMEETFAAEWTRVSAQGWPAQTGYAIHLLFDLFRTVGVERARRVTGAGLLASAAILFSLVYFHSVPTSLPTRISAFTSLSATFGVIVMINSGRRRWRQWALAAFGLPLGMVTGWLMNDAKRFAPNDVDGPFLYLPSPRLTAEGILRRVEKTYTEAKTYADTGNVRTIFSGVVGHTAIKPFHTAFDRQKGVLFEFEEIVREGSPAENYVVWQEGTVTKEWWSLRPTVKIHDTLTSALESAAGVSNFASIQIPSLLDLQVPGRRFLPQAKISRLLGGQRIEGKLAFKLEVITRPRGDAVFVWVDAVSYLVLRTQRFSTIMSGTHVDEVTNYRPQLDLVLPTSLLSYHPPLLYKNADGFAVLKTGLSALELLTVAAFAMNLILIGANIVHRRALRRSWKRKEVWTQPIMKRQVAGSAAIYLFLGGVVLAGLPFTSLGLGGVVALSLLQGGISLYFIQRRRRGYARLA